MTLQEAIGQVATLEQQVSYLVDDITKNNEERSRLVTHLDICRMSLQLSTQEHQKLDSTYVELEGKLKITESLLGSEQTILKLRTGERDKLTKELEAANDLISVLNNKIKSLIEENKGMKNTLALYAKNED